MRIDKIVNEAPQRVAIIFGRFNPPHYGHKAAWETASKFDQWFVGTNKSTIGEKDPLPYEVKIEAMKAVWPEVADHIMTEQSWFTMASKVYEQFGPVVLIVVTDETDKDWIMPVMVKNNGTEGPHGYYNFPKIVWQKAARISSATDLRGAVAKGDKAAFEKAAGVSADTPVAGSTFYEVVSKYLMPYLHAKAEKERIKAEREAAKAAKTKKESVTEVAPPGMEKWIKDRKPEFKKRYGDRWQEVLYATAWKQKKNESVEENAEQKFAVTYDIYGSNKEKPLYTKTRTVRAKSEQEAIEILRKLVGGTNYRVEKQGVAEGSDGAVSFREMIDVVDQHYPKYYAELSGSDISDKQFERAIVNAYKEIIKKQSVAEGKDNLESLRAKAKQISDKIDSIVQSGGRVGLDDPLSRQLKAIRNKIKQAKQGVAEGWKEKVGAAALAGAVATGASANTPKVPVDKAIQQATAVYNINKAVKKQKEKSKEETPKKTDKEVKEQGVAEEKTRLDPKCWDGYKKQGTKMKGGVRVNNCVKESFTPMQIALMEGGHSLYEDASTLNIGDPVIITGKGIEFEGTTGEIVEFGQDKKFVIVNLYNHGKHSFHSSDVSYNDYADSDEEEARMYDRGEFRDDFEESADKVAGRHDPEEFDDLVKRVGQRAKQGPMKTVWDPVKRVYKNVPVKQDTEEVDEASLATMRKYFAGDTDAKDQTKLAQMRDFFNKHRDDFSDGIQRKEFNSMASYQQWLERQGMKKISKDKPKG